MNMKLNLLCVFLALCCAEGFAVETAVKTCIRSPGVTASYELLQSRVLRIVISDDEERRKVSYVVKWKDSEAVISDPRASGNYKTGDTISFFAIKISGTEQNTGMGERRVFTLANTHSL